MDPWQVNLFPTTSLKAARCPPTLPSAPAFSRQRLMTFAFSWVSGKRPLSTSVDTKHQISLANNAGKVSVIFFFKGNCFLFFRRGFIFYFLFIYSLCFQGCLNTTLWGTEVCHELVFTVLCCGGRMVPSRYQAVKYLLWRQGKPDLCLGFLLTTFLPLSFLPC